MSLSAREQRILSGIARDLAADEPRLARALATARLPVRRLALTGIGHGPRSPWLWTAAVVAPLLAGIALLTSGLILSVLALACAGAVLTQVSPVLGCLRARARRRPARPGNRGR